MYFVRIFSEKIQEIRYHKVVGELVAGYKEDIEALEQEKDREIRRGNRVINDIKTRLKDSEQRYMAEIEDAEVRLEDAEERHMAEKENDDMKIKD